MTVVGGPLARDELDLKTPVPQARPHARLRWGQLVRPLFLAVVLLLLYLYVHSKTLDSIEHRELTASIIGSRTLAHVKLSIVATVITLAVAVPLGVLVSRRAARFATPVILGLGNLGQAIPSIGLVVLLTFPQGIGFWTAITALVAYSVLPVLRNTMIGLQQVDSSLIESARGMGMTRTATLGRVELPLAVPVILAGVRTALVLTVATAALATFIGAGGLGDGLVPGIKLGRDIVTLTYGVLVAVLALFADWLGGLAESMLRPRGI